MTISETSQKDLTTGMTSENPSFPSLISSQNCELSLSYTTERKELEKNKNERQSPVLAEGEVDLRKGTVFSEKKIQFPSELDQSLKSTVKNKVSNDKFIEKQTSDLGTVSNYVSGERSNPDKAPTANPDDEAEKLGDPDEDDDDDMGADDAAILSTVDPYKVGRVSGSSKQQENAVAEMLRRNQWMHDWHSPASEISSNQAHAHLKHSVNAIESEELKAHLKTTGILIKGVKSELSQVNEKVESIKNHVDMSLGRMITKTQASTILSNQDALQKSQKSILDKMQAMDAKFDILMSYLQNADAKKGEKALTLTTKCSPDLKPHTDDKEGGDGGGSAKDKEPTVVKSAVEQQRYTAAGSSRHATDSSSSQGQRHQILMDTSLMLYPESISKRCTQEVKTEGRKERLFYRDPRLLSIDEELAKKINQELNPDYDFEESLEELRRVEKEQTPKATRGRGKGRGRGRTPSLTTRPIEKGIIIREQSEQSRSTLSSQTAESTDTKGKGILIE